ncbi:hypothetical protein FisN_UnNu003 [Fistulifera solaris]|uniref:Uncharacterized protein n=1 Tax=Fistulifera solaris TaxID=1519565 RepID=A0A1Z5J758_FISSO|nr:hypothetical protein FisN_UnNu003 [Fistulifera solaris]|eukprot:GAX09752.1 hypothetical protein FisN_UnNu003 [Fistulifera solaris]
MSARLKKHPVTGHPTKGNANKPVKNKTKTAATVKTKAPAAKGKPKKAAPSMEVMFTAPTEDRSGKVKKGYCDLGHPRCQNRHFELRNHYRCVKCGFQLHNSEFGCGHPYDDAGHVICPDGFGCDLGRKIPARGNLSSDDSNDGDSFTPQVTHVKRSVARLDDSSDESESEMEDSDLGRLHRKRPPQTPMLRELVPLNDGEFPIPDPSDDDQTTDGKPAAKETGSKKTSSASKTKKSSPTDSDVPDSDGKPVNSFFRLYFDTDGKVVGYDNKTWKEISAQAMRTIVSQCTGMGTRSMPKHEMIQAMEKEYDEWDQMGRPPPGNNLGRHGKQKVAPDKATANCKMRLFNVVFSADHVSDLENLMKKGDGRDNQDIAMAKHQQWFWRPVRESYVDSIEEYGINKYEDNEYFKDRPGLDLNHFCEHPWKKLREMWKACCAEYNRHKKNYTASGQHSNDFYQFTNGNLVMYYFHLCLRDKPNVIDVVEADLPDQEGRNGNAYITVAAGNKRKKETAFTDILKELVDREPESSEIKELVEFHKQSHELEIKKLQFAQSTYDLEEERRQEEKRAALWEELKDVDNRLERLFVILDNDPPQHRVEYYRSDLTTYMNRKEELKAILFPKADNDPTHKAV